MIINADNYVPVKSIDGRATPYNTGKVQIGLLYQPKPPEMTASEEIIRQRCWVRARFTNRLLRGP